MSADAPAGNRRKMIVETSEDEDDTPLGKLKTNTSSQKKPTPHKSSATAAKTAQGKSKSTANSKSKVKARVKDAAKAKGKKYESEVDENIPRDARKYFKEGQRYITPPNGDGTRAFYESLYDENPNSLIAIRYCVEYGVLTGTKHHEALAKFEFLKEAGVYKGTQGGLQPEYKNGLPKNWEKLLAKSGKASPKKSAAKTKAKSET